MIHHLSRASTLAALSTAVASNAIAANVINPAGVTLTGADALFPASHLIDGSGLEFPVSNGAPLPATWNHRWGSPATDSWVTGAPCSTLRFNAKHRTTIP